MSDRIDLGNLTYDLHPWMYQGHKVIFKVIRMENQKYIIEMMFGCLQHMW